MAARILVTGASGFIGSALCSRLRTAGFIVREAFRNLPPNDLKAFDGLERVVLHDRSTETETYQALEGVQGVVHLAARVHVMSDQAADPLAEFRKINLAWTERFAQAAATQGVGRFVYLSSIKVQGEQSVVPFTEQDPPNPQDPYGVSKWEAEQALASVSLSTKMKTVVVRSPLVYGPGVGGNFLQLMSIVCRGVPLPLARVQNRRSLVYRGNLIDALIRCLEEPRAADQTYLVSDGDDLSTPELIRRLGQALGHTVRLWSLPTSWLRSAGWVTGKQAMFDRLLGSLQVNPSKIMRELNWYPPFTVEAGLLETGAWFRAGHSVCRHS